MSCGGRVAMAAQGLTRCDFVRPYYHVGVGRVAMAAQGLTRCDPPRPIIFAENNF